MSALLTTALKCAFFPCDLASYTALCLKFCGLPCIEEQTRVWGNLVQIFTSARPPLPEPSLTGKTERVSVGSATKSWTSLLVIPGPPTEVDITGFPSCLEVGAILPQEVVAGGEVFLTLLPQNKGTWPWRSRGWGPHSVTHTMTSSVFGRRSSVLGQEREGVCLSPPTPCLVMWVKRSV